MAVNSSSSRVGTSTNLGSGATYDLLLVKYMDGFPEGRISFGIHSTPMKISGLQKVAQIFMKTLITSLGSDPFYPNKGTRFASLMRSANIVTTDPVLMEEIRTSVASAAAQTAATTRVQNLDPASQLQSVDILGLDAGEDSVVLYVHMKTMAGVTASVSLPFPNFGVA